MSCLVGRSPGDVDEKREDFDRPALCLDEGPVRVLRLPEWNRCGFSRVVSAADTNERLPGRRRSTAARAAAAVIANEVSPARRRPCVCLWRPSTVRPRPGAAARRRQRAHGEQPPRRPRDRSRAKMPRASSSAPAMRPGPRAAFRGDLPSAGRRCEFLAGGREFGKPSSP